MGVLLIIYITGLITHMALYREITGRKVHLEIWLMLGLMWCVTWPSIYLIYFNKKDIRKDDGER